MSICVRAHYDKFDGRVREEVVRILVVFCFGKVNGTVDALLRILAGRRCRRPLKKCIDLEFLDRYDIG